MAPDPGVTEERALRFVFSAAIAAAAPAANARLSDYSLITFLQSVRSANLPLIPVKGPGSATSILTMLNSEVRRWT